MTAQSGAVRTDNPYVGPRAFAPGDPIYGRDQARDELLDLVIAERIVLLYSPSGAGKTSLIQAALTRALITAGFEVLPIVRLGHSAGTLPAGLPARNRYVLSALLSLEEGLSPEQQLPLDVLARITLADYLRQRPDQDDRPGNEVLVFDQFEEVLTDATDEDARREFFAELGEALRDRSHWAVFAMREDYLAALDPYLRHIPTRFRSRYRLDLLTADQAVDAIVEPARAAGVEFAPDAARGLVDDLRRVRVQHADGTSGDALGQYVEPVQLQVACRLLWSRLPSGATQIRHTDGAVLGDVEDALATYYAGTVALAASRARVREAVLREWFENALITRQGLRGQVLEGPLGDDEGDRVVLRELVAAHLIRPETRRQATWFELSHDRFIEPIKRDNEAWRNQHLTPFERAAILWEAESRSDRLLLTGPALADALQTAASRPEPVSRREAEFLDASRAADERRLRDVRNAARLRRRAVGLAVTAGLAVAALVATFGLFEKATRDKQAAGAEELRQQLLFDAQQELKWEQESGVVLAARSTALNAAGSLDPSTRDLLYLADQASPVSFVMRGHDHAASAADISDDGSVLATAEGSTVRVWRRGTSEATATFEMPGKDFVVLTLSPGGDHVAAGTDDGDVALWDVATGRSTTWADPSGLAWNIDVAPGGDAVVGVGADNVVTVWDGEGAALMSLTHPDEYSTSAAFSPDGRRVVTVGQTDDGASGTAVVWDVETGAELSRLELDPGAVTVQFGLDGKKIAVVDVNLDATVIDLDSGQATSSAAARGLVYRSVSADLTRVLSVWSWGELDIQDLSSGEALGTVTVPGSALVAAVLDPADPMQALVLPEAADPSLWRLEAPTEAKGIADSDVAGADIVTAWTDGSIRLSRGEATQDRALKLLDAYAAKVDMSPSTKHLVLVTPDGVAEVRLLATGTRISVLGLDTALAADAAFLDDRTVVTVDKTGDIRLWDATTGAPIKDLPTPGPLQNPCQIEPAPDGTAVLVLECAFVADGETAIGYIVPTDGQSAVTLMPDVAQRAQSRGFQVSQYVSAAAWISDGARVAVASDHGTVAVFNRCSGDQEWARRLHRDYVWSVADAPNDGVLTMSDDGALRLSSAASGDERGSIPLESGSVAVVPSEEEQWIRVVQTDGSVITLPLNDRDLVRAVRDKVVRHLTPEQCAEYDLDPC